MKLLQEQLEVARVERSSLAAARDREDELSREVKHLSEELVEAKRYHTPVLFVCTCVNVCMYRT